MSEAKWVIPGSMLKELRTKTGLSVFKVAKQVHISGNYISLLERGINAPSDTILMNLAEFYGLEPSELFKLYDRVTPPKDERLSSIPLLKKIMTEISIDSRLTHEEKEAFAQRVYQVVNDFIINKEDIK